MPHAGLDGLRSVVPGAAGRMGEEEVREVGVGWVDAEPGPGAQGGQQAGPGPAAGG
ncbi:hypothetical protein [Streptomyces piniterrae]|uniref:hypothetical protein n=1 Tax=Streptomyces piniterrae TaxID=2571125 RepID=UPI00145D57E1|nr:hypothetical protein [Streptomyces piniterrae]